MGLVWHRLLGYESMNKRHAYLSIRYIGIFILLSLLDSQYEFAALRAHERHSNLPDTEVCEENGI